MNPNLNSTAPSAARAGLQGPPCFPWLQWTFIFCLSAGCVSLSAAPSPNANAAAAPGATPPSLFGESLPSSRFLFEGPLGERIAANVHHWLYPAPVANPAMIQIFALRERKTARDLPPGASAYAGQYLAAAAQALRSSHHPELKERVRQTASTLIASQSPDGYLGPFPPETRLKNSWDFWGHYHCIRGLLAWHETSGDPSALEAARRAADFICNFPKPHPSLNPAADSPERSTALLHAFGWLYQLTPEPRYLHRIREMEKDWSENGDYFRQGLAGIEFFQTPRPHWESLLNLRGLAELYRITGEESYRASLTRHWRSILRWDRRNTGGFSSDGRATGNPFAPTAIETSATAAWMGVNIDLLELTGDPAIADELEISTYNAILGAQHPSGRWWAASAPMNGIRETAAASPSIRPHAGMPEINPASLSGPQALGMLADWAVLNTPDGFAINFYGPGKYQGKLRDNTPIAFQWQTDYPLGGKVQLRVEPLAPRRFTLRLRIPGWSRDAAARLNQTPLTNAIAGRYLEITRRWQESDLLTLEFDLSPRLISGDQEASGHVSVFRGPILLAYDQVLNEFDAEDIPALDIRRLAGTREVSFRKSEDKDPLAPWLLLDLPAANGRKIRVCDFASAGSKGTYYQTWLRSSELLPPRVTPRSPADGGALDISKPSFAWTGPIRPGALVKEYHLAISAVEDFNPTLLEKRGIPANRVSLTPDETKLLKPGQRYYWKVFASNPAGISESADPPSVFTVSADSAR